MHTATLFFALAVVATASASAIGANIVARPAYRVSYGVSDKVTGDQKTAAEVRDGDVTKGSYSVVQPDGILRTVNYIVTPLGGFQAQVINKGVSGHPAVVGAGLGAVVAPRVAVAAPAVAVARPALAVAPGLGLVGNSGVSVRNTVGGVGLGLASPLALNGLGLGWGAGLGLNAGLGLGAGVDLRGGLGLAAGLGGWGLLG